MLCSYVELSLARQVLDRNQGRNRIDCIDRNQELYIIWHVIDKNWD